MTLSPIYNDLPKNIQSLLFNVKEENWIKTLNKSQPKKEKEGGEYLATVFKTAVDHKLRNSSVNALQTRLFLNKIDKTLSDKALEVYEIALSEFKKLPNLPERKRKKLDTPPDTSSKKRKPNEPDSSSTTPPKTEQEDPNSKDSNPDTWDALDLMRNLDTLNIPTLDNPPTIPTTSMDVDSLFPNDPLFSNLPMSLFSRNLHLSNPDSNKITPSRGLVNLGVSCYLNTTLQCLCTPEFKYLLTNKINASHVAKSQNIDSKKLEKLEKLQTTLLRLVNRLSTNAADSSNKPISTRELHDLLDQLIDSKFIRNKNTQYDATEVIDALSASFGIDLTLIKTQLITKFDDNSQEISLVGNKKSNFLFEIMNSKQTTMSALLRLICAPEGMDQRIVRFLVTDANGLKIARLDRTFAPDKDHPGIGLATLAAARHTSRTKVTTEEELENTQIEILKEHYASLNREVTIKKILATSRYTEITELPSLLHIRLQPFDADFPNPSFEENLSLNPYLSPNLDRLSEYRLESIICRRGARINDSSGGHYWYWKKKGDLWVKYNDAVVTSYPTDTEVRKDFEATAYACSYRKRSINNNSSSSLICKEIGDVTGLVSSEDNDALIDTMIGYLDPTDYLPPSFKTAILEEANRKNLSSNPIHNNTIREEIQSIVNKIVSRFDQKNYLKQLQASLLQNQTPDSNPNTVKIIKPNGEIIQESKFMEDQALAFVTEFLDRPQS